LEKEAKEKERQEYLNDMDYTVANATLNRVRAFTFSRDKK